MARQWMAVLVVPMFAAALVAPDDPLGRLGRLALIVGSCVTVRRRLAGAAPSALLKAGVSFWHADAAASSSQSR